jgi:hypothetical protein
MKRRRSLYARPRNLPRTAVRRGALQQWSDTKQLPWYGRAASVAITEPTLVAKPQTRAHRRGSACPAGRLCGRGDQGCPSACRAVRPFPVRADTTGHAVSGRLSDGGVHCGRWTRPRGHWTGPGLQRFRHRAWGRLGRRRVGRWALEVSAAWPSPSGRSRGPPCRRPASHCRVSEAEPIGGDGVQAGVRRRHPGGSGRLPGCGHVRQGWRGPRAVHRAVGALVGGR